MFVWPTGPGAIKKDQALDFPETAAQTCSDRTMAVNGTQAGDVVMLGIDNAAIPANGSFSAWASAANTVTIRFCNPTALAVDPSRGTFGVVVSRR